MKVKIILLVLIIMSITVSGIVESSGVDEFTISGLHIGSNSNDVIKTLGKPIKKKQWQETLNNDIKTTLYYETWIYNGISVDLIKGVENTTNGGLISLSVKNPNYKTKRGIKTGDSLNKLLSTYHGIKKIEGSDGVIEYDYREGLNVMGFIIEKNKITEIKLWDENY